MTHQEEKKNQRIAMFTSLGIHAALFLLFLFMVAWRAPNPPHPEYGIEINLGSADVGSGEVQPTEPVGSEGAAEEEPEQPAPAEEEPAPEQPEEVEPTPVEENIVSKVESPEVIKEKKEEVKEPEKPVEKKEDPKPKVEPVKPTVDKNAEYKPKAQTESSNKTTEPKQGQAGSQGDDVDKTGDKGKEGGVPDPNAGYSGKPGGGGNGLGLAMAGWGWVKQPEIPKTFSTPFSGKITFEIVVDENGLIQKITTKERSLNYEDERALRAAIEKAQLEKNSAGDAPPLSSGTVTFTLRRE